MNDTALFTTKRYAPRRALGPTPAPEDLADFAVHVGPPTGEPIDAAPATFILERWADITFDPNEDWLIKRIVPRRGSGAIYGKTQAFKSFVAMHIALSVALGLAWAGRPVHKGARRLHRRGGRGRAAQAQGGLRHGLAGPTARC